jgi:ABC-type glycerol-3-phosphate transport system permease component
MGLTCLIPFVNLLAISFSDSGAVAAGRVMFWPVNFNAASYEFAMTNGKFFPALWISIQRVVLGVGVNLLMMIMAAYPLSRKDLVGRNFIMVLFTLTMIFSGGMIPTYILVSNLGLINTRWALMLPNMIWAWNVIITRTYYQSTIPQELLEAAQIDGCTNLNFILRVVLPLSSAITAVNVLFYAVGIWNVYFDALLYINNADLQPLQIILRNILVLNTFDNRYFTGLTEMSSRVFLKEAIKYSLIIVASVPVLCMYPFVQKYFVKGVMIGGIKG